MHWKRPVYKLYRAYQGRHRALGSEGRGVGGDLSDGSPGRERGVTSRMVLPQGPQRCGSCEAGGNAAQGTDADSQR